ncbi:hypothetical protein VTL71DRAFT_75 [Oculimacula yallundae]|uniref:RlpA-like protein double-psi beta-barrel domain-containing protein n=1 Tax=Oculimacula yallundae TaxID=86028 RepID=A0ABR4CZ57_9HELO
MKVSRAITLFSSPLVFLTAAAPLNTTSESLIGRAVQHGRATFYVPGLGACGMVNNPGDFVVAISSYWGWDRYPGEHCFQQIHVSAKGKVLALTVVNECPTCGQNDIDLSPAAFRQWASTDAGVFEVDWWFA